MRTFRYAAPAAAVLVIVALALVRSHRALENPCSGSALLMDTLAEVSVWGKGHVPCKAAADSALAALAQVDTLLGTGRLDTRGDSTRMRSTAVRRALEVSDQVYRLTGGLFDPTIGSVTRLWSFGEDGKIPDPDSLAEGLRHVGFDRFLAARDSGKFIIDLGGVAKGYAVDLAASRLVDLGFKSAIVSAGGDMRLIGRRPDGKLWRIAIRHPRRAGEFIGYLNLADVAVATSGDYERCFIRDGRRYHHIIDPRTGMPGTATTCVTVIAKTSVVSDALATGLFLMGPRDGLRLAESLPDVEAVFVWAEGESLATTSGLEHVFERAEPK
ncbi:MAG TPA: FAD:protein FMN transferase [bacterium]|nr:FAD:protein FMN transferase [bacterium]